MERRACVLGLLAAFLLLVIATAQMPGMPGIRGRKEFSAVKADLPFIRCQVCEAVAKHTYRHVKTAREALKPGKTLSEAEIQDKLERAADPLKDEGEWVARCDLAESGSKLKVVEMEAAGKCEEECKTVQRAAQELLDDHDTDMAELLFKGKMTRAQYTNWLCYEASAACTAKPPPLPKGRKPGPAFKEVDPKEAEMDKLMASMKDAGLGGQLYDRESMMKQMGGMGGGVDEDEDEDDDEPVGTPEAAAKAADDAKGTISDTIEKVKDAAGAAVESAREGLTSALKTAKDLVSGVAGGAADKAAATAEL